MDRRLVDGDLLVLDLWSALPHPTVQPAWVVLELVGTRRSPSAPLHGPADRESEPPRTGRITLIRSLDCRQDKHALAAEGYRFAAVMGGDTEFGDGELVAVMVRDAESGSPSYRLLATNSTSTMQEELQQAGADGYDYRGQTVYESFFGGQEIVIILERDEAAPTVRFDYQLLATNRTSTMQQELGAAGRRGFELVGLTVAETGFPEGSGARNGKTVRRTVQTGFRIETRN